MTNNGNHRTTLQVVRAAIYTRKSSEEGLEQEFNSLDAQRESAEAYVASLRGEGWTLVPTRYDDGGFSGGNTDRPGLRRLLADIEDGKVDAVIVYKVDRLSRSLLDFAKMMELFEWHGVAFTSITQQFNTANSMGRLVLNVLLSFAQFEREIISERTRDKIAATRRKGKWAGGRPLLGYDVDANRSKLVVNEDEAAKVRDIFALYEERGSLMPVVEELERRGWANKKWTTKAGHERGGRPFDRTSLYRTLTNPTYAGKTKYKAEVHQGEHPALIDPDTFDRVQTMLRRNAVNGGPQVRNEFGYLLKGLIRCTACDSAMTPSHTSKKGKVRYRYYTCCSAQKKGWRSCPAKSILAADIEDFVVGKVRCVGRDTTLVQTTLAEAHDHDEARLTELEAERRTLEKDMAKWQAEERKLASQARPGDDGPVAARLADVLDKIAGGQRRHARVKEQLHQIRREQVDASEAAEALAAFDLVWESLTPSEQARVIRLLVKRVDYDGKAGKVTVTFHPTAIKTLAAELAAQHQEIA